MDPWNILGWILVGLFVLPVIAALIAAIVGLVGGVLEGRRIKARKEVR